MPNFNNNNNFALKGFVLSFAVGDKKKQQKYFNVLLWVNSQKIISVISLITQWQEQTAPSNFFLLEKSGK